MHIAARVLSCVWTLALAVPVSCESLVIRTAVCTVPFESERTPHALAAAQAHIAVTEMLARRDEHATVAAGATALTDALSRYPQYRFGFLTLAEALSYVDAPLRDTLRAYDAAASLSRTAGDEGSAGLALFNSGLLLLDDDPGGAESRFWEAWTFLRPHVHRVPDLRAVAMGAAVSISQLLAQRMDIPAARALLNEAAFLFPASASILMERANLAFLESSGAAAASPSGGGEHSQTQLGTAEYGTADRREDAASMLTRAVGLAEAAGDSTLAETARRNLAIVTSSRAAQASPSNSDAGERISAASAALLRQLLRESRAASTGAGDKAADQQSQQQQTQQQHRRRISAALVVVVTDQSLFSDVSTDRSMLNWDHLADTEAAVTTVMAVCAALVAARPIIYDEQQKQQQQQSIAVNTLLPPASEAIHAHANASASKAYLAASPPVAGSPADQPAATPPPPHGPMSPSGPDTDSLNSVVTPVLRACQRSAGTWMPFVQSYFGSSSAPWDNVLNAAVTSMRGERFAAARDGSAADEQEAAAAAVFAATSAVTGAPAAAAAGRPGSSSYNQATTTHMPRRCLRPLSVAIAGYDMRSHATGYLLEGEVRAADPSRTRISVYQYGPIDPETPVLPGYSEACVFHRSKGAQQQQTHCRSSSRGGGGDNSRCGGDANSSAPCALSGVTLLSLIEEQNQQQRQQTSGDQQQQQQRTTSPLFSWNWSRELRLTALGIGATQSERLIREAPSFFAVFSNAAHAGVVAHMEGRIQCSGTTAAAAAAGPPCAVADVDAGCASASSSPTAVAGCSASTAAGCPTSTSVWRPPPIDILIDPMANTFGHRESVVAAKSARIVASHMVAATSGLGAVDWFIGDPVKTPPDYDTALLQLGEPATRLLRGVGVLFGASTTGAVRRPFAYRAPQWKPPPPPTSTSSSAADVITPQRKPPSPPTSTMTASAADVLTVPAAAAVPASAAVTTSSAAVNRKPPPRQLEALLHHPIGADVLPRVRASESTSRTHPPRRHPRRNGGISSTTRTGSPAAAASGSLSLFPTNGTMIQQQHYSFSEPDAHTPSLLGVPRVFARSFSEKMVLLPVSYSMNYYTCALPLRVAGVSASISLRPGADAVRSAVAAVKDSVSRGTLRHDLEVAVGEVHRSGTPQDEVAVGGTSVRSSGSIPQVGARPRRLVCMVVAILEKIDPALYSAWMHILSAVPTADLWLLGAKKDDAEGARPSSATSANSTAAAHSSSSINDADASSARSPVAAAAAAVESPSERRTSPSIAFASLDINNIHGRRTRAAAAANGTRGVLFTDTSSKSDDGGRTSTWVRPLPRLVESDVTRPFQRLLQEAAARGVSPSRIRLLPRVSRDEYITRLGASADIVLDTRVYSGHTTTLDALWTGVPVVTIEGATVAARVSSSHLQAGGADLSSVLVTHSMSAFEDTAIALLRSSSALGALRRRVLRAATRCAHLNWVMTSRNLERAYAAMWEEKALQSTTSTLAMREERAATSTSHVVVDPDLRAASPCVDDDGAAPRDGAHDEHLGAPAAEHRHRAAADLRSRHDAAAGLLLHHLGFSYAAERCSAVLRRS